MKKIFISILVLISIQSFGQTPDWMKKKIVERMSSAGVIDSFYNKLFTDSIFAYSNDAFICHTTEWYRNHPGEIMPNNFGNFHLGADGVYRNFTPRAEAVPWSGIENKPAAITNATTTGLNLLTLSIPASNSIVVATAAGNAITRTQAEVKADLLLNNVDNTSDVTKNSASANLTNKTMGAFNAALDAGANDSYVVTLSPAPAAYTTGMIVIFRANTVNIGAASINVNGLGVRTIVKRVNTNLANGDILALQWCMIVYDGTNFVLMNPVVN